MSDKAQNTVDAIATRQKTSTSDIRNLLIRSTDELQKALPKGALAESFVRVLLTTVNGNRTLQNCDPMSILRAAFEAAALGLPIDGVLGHAYLVPFKGKAQLLIGYKGFCELAYRSGVKRIAAEVVYENDEFTYQEGTEPHLTHRKPMVGDRGKIIGTFAVAHMDSGPGMFRVLRMDEVEARRARSASAKSGRSSPWDTDFEAMVRKTAIRALAPTLPQSPEMKRAAAADDLRDLGIQPTAAFGTDPVIDVEAIVKED